MSRNIDISLPFQIQSREFEFSENSHILRYSFDIIIKGTFESYTITVSPYINFDTKESGIHLMSDAALAFRQSRKMSPYIHSDPVEYAQYLGTIINDPLKKIEDRIQDYEGDVYGDRR